MNKRKLGTILATIAGVGLFVCFVLFTVGGFMSVRYMKNSPLVIIGFVGFAGCIVLLVVSAVIRHSGDIKTLTTKSTSFMENMVDAGKSILDKVSSMNSITCAYCGTVYDKKEGKCPNCGSSNREE